MLKAKTYIDNDHQRRDSFRSEFDSSYFALDNARRFYSIRGESLRRDDITTQNQTIDFYVKTALMPAEIMLKWLHLFILSNETISSSPYIKSCSQHESVESVSPSTFSLGIKSERFRDFGQLNIWTTGGLVMVAPKLVLTRSKSKSTVFLQQGRS